MILDDIKKVIKQNCKKQGRNITTGVVVAFLLGTMGTYAKDGITIENTGNQITIKPEGIGILEKDRWTNKEFINTQSGNGVKVQGNSIEFDIFNEGIISGNGSGTLSGELVFSGNGIFNDKSAKIRTIFNEGIISGNGSGTLSGELVFSGNGVFNDELAE